MIVENATAQHTHNVLFFGNSNKQSILETIEQTSPNLRILSTMDEETAFNCIHADHPQIVLVDYDRNEFKPLDFIKKLENHPNGHVVLGITENAPVEMIVKSLQMGVKDVIHLNEEPARLPQRLESLVVKDMPEKNVSHYEKQRRLHDFQYILKHSPALENLFMLISRIVMRKWVTVLITGETGTGKGVVARAIHYKSFTAKRPFVEINCNALPEQLLESELFGHERGAFTDAKTQKKGLFELADNGTLFLDEIGDVTQSTQSKLLKAIEEKTIRRVGGTEDIKVNARIITATNRNLDQAIKEGAFRTDLYYRLNVVSFHLPPLRVRRYDTSLLAKKFLDDYALEYDSPVKGFTAPAMQMLKDHKWPGNVRELKHTIERMVLLSDAEKLDVSHIQDALRSEMHKMDVAGTTSAAMSIEIPPEGITLEEGEQLIIQAILDKNGGNKRKACNILGISRPTLDRKLEKFSM